MINYNAHMKTSMGERREDERVAEAIIPYNGEKLAAALF